MEFGQNIYDIWSRKKPLYLEEYETQVIKPLCDFGKGTSDNSDAKAKVLGAAYEVLIMAFFIGLYSNKKKKLDEYADKKDCGHAIQHWGNLESKKLRRGYPRLREYMFVALVARTPGIDWIELDKGNLTASEVVSQLMDTMEEYINYGLSVLYEKLKDDADYFFNKNSFLDIIMTLTNAEECKQSNTELEPID